MSDVDKRIVQMEFDNSKFDKNVKKSTSALEKFEEKLRFEDIEDSLKVVTKGFSSLEIVAISALSNITNRVVNLGIRLVKSLSVDNITAGWSKYEEKIQSVATLAAQKIVIAGKIIEDQDEKLAAINEQMDKLNWFTDETSYNFTEMAKNIGYFTAAGVDLDKAVNAMMGIATWAALSGKNANVASNAMYQLSQSMGQGYVLLQDWKSIETAGMATEEFKNTLLQTALEMGELTKSGNEFVTKLVKSLHQKHSEVR